MEFEGDETEQNPNITNTVVEDDDDPPMLSSHSLDALKEFLNEQKQQQQSTTSISSDEISLVSEDWRLSQFWYHPETAEMVAGEVRRLSVVASSPVACIACPTLYAYLKKLDPSICAKILEYDRRFEQYGSDFTFYDYNLPEELAPELKHAFRVVVVDPPYLSKECLEKVARTIEFLLRPGESYLLLLTERKSC